jgi:hypothetical protein
MEVNWEKMILPVFAQQLRYHLHQAFELGRRSFHTVPQLQQRWIGTGLPHSQEGLQHHDMALGEAARCDRPPRPKQLHPARSLVRIDVEPTVSESNASDGRRRALFAAVVIGIERSSLTFRFETRPCA